MNRTTRIILLVVGLGLVAWYVLKKIVQPAATNYVKNAVNNGISQSTAGALSAGSASIINSTSKAIGSGISNVVGNIFDGVANSANGLFGNSTSSDGGFGDDPSTSVTSSFNSDNSFVDGGNDFAMQEVT